MKSFAIIELAQKRLAAAEENYALVNEAYLDGATSFLDVVDPGGDGVVRQWQMRVHRHLRALYPAAESR